MEMFVLLANTSGILENGSRGTMVIKKISQLEKETFQLCSLGRLQFVDIAALEQAILLFFCSLILKKISESVLKIGVCNRRPAGETKAAIVSYRLLFCACQMRISSIACHTSNYATKTLHFGDAFNKCLRPTRSNKITTCKNYPLHLTVL